MEQRALRFSSDRVAIGLENERPETRWIYLARLSALSVLYFGAAKLGLLTALVGGNVTLIWPPAGIAAAALIASGTRMWPGVFLGACWATASTGVHWGVALGIGIGNTLEAVAGAYVLRRVADFRPSLSRYRDILAFTVISSLLSSLLAATIGTLTLCLGGVCPWGSYGAVWRSWWIGDAIGILILAPVLLTWAKSPVLRWTRGQSVEAGILFATVLIVGYAVFGEGLVVRVSQAPLAYVVFPFVIWAALRFEQRGATTVGLLLSSSAIWGTVRGRGPFVSQTLNESLVLLQSFMGIVMGTAMVLAAIMMERTEAWTSLARLNAALDTKVVERTAALEQARGEVERLMSVRAQEVSAAVHDLGHGLQSVQATFDVLFLELEEAGAEPGRLEAASQRIQSTLDAQGALLGDMRDAALLESRALVLRPEATEIGELVRKAAERISARCRAEGVALSLALAGAPLMSFCDPARIGRVLDNVLENAVRYTSAFREQGGAITVSLEPAGAMITCTVRDNGPGITEEALSRVGTRFSRFAEGASAPAGTGQGLSFCKGIMELTGGKLIVASPGKGEGATVTLHLPREENEKSQ